MPRASIGFYLVFMVCAIALPVLAFAALLLAQLQIDERAVLERRTEREAQSLASGVGRVLQEMSTTLRLLVTSPELAAGDLRSFHNRAEAALRSGPLFVLLVDEDGQQLLNTRVPYGTPLGKTSNMEALRVALQAREITVSDVFFGATSGGWVFNVILPLPEALAPQGAALIITKNADELTSLTASEGLPAGWTEAVVDGSGNLVASSDGPGISRGRLFDERLSSKFRVSSGVVYGASGDPGNIVGYAQPSGWPWTAVVWGPVAAAQASILSTWRLLLLGGLAALAIAVATALFLARQLRSSVRGIADMAERVGRGEVVAPIDSRIREVDMVAKALCTASFERSQAEDRIHLTLRELAHRSKNLLAVIQSMIYQTTRTSETPADFQRSISERIAALGRSIDLLTSKERSGVPMGRVLETHLATFLETREQLQTRGDNFLLKADAVQNLGLVLHELATNAVKYGALSVPEGRIDIEWQLSEAVAGQPQLRLSWQELGGPAASPPHAKGFGSQIVEGHAASAFKGKVTVDYRDSGLVWILEAPLEAFVNDAGAVAEAS